METAFDDHAVQNVSRGPTSISVAPPPVVSEESALVRPGSNVSATSQRRRPSCSEVRGEAPAASSTVKHRSCARASASGRAARRRRRRRACCRSISLMAEAPREARSAAASLGSGEADLKKRTHGGRAAPSFIRFAVSSPCSETRFFVGSIKLREAPASSTGIAVTAISNAMATPNPKTMPSCLNIGVGTSDRHTNPTNVVADV